MPRKAIPWDKKEELAWVTEKIKDYLYDEEETYFHVDLYFEAGDKRQVKKSTWILPESEEGKDIRIYTMSELAEFECDKCGCYLAYRNFYPKFMKYCPDCGNKSSGRKLELFKKLYGDKYIEGADDCCKVGEET